MLGDPLLGRDHLDVLAELAAEELPALVDVPVQADGLVLGQHEDLAEVGVDAVREGEVDDPVDPAERDRRLGPVARQRLQARSPASRPGRPPARRDTPCHLRSVASIRCRAVPTDRESAGSDAPFVPGFARDSTSRHAARPSQMKQRGLKPSACSTISKSPGRPAPAASASSGRSAAAEPPRRGDST